MKYFFLFFFCSTSLVFSQEDCFLCIGGKDDEAIKEVFKLTDEQAEQLRNWGAELKFRNEIFEFRANKLLENHAQSAPEDLIKMSFEYKAILDSIDANMRLLDRRLLGTFSKEQYQLYMMLCNAVQRSPMYPDKRKRKK